MRAGNLNLRRILLQAAHGAKIKRGTFHQNKYNKLIFKLVSANRAKAAIANRLARAIYLILGGDKYRELGYLRVDPHRQKVQKFVNQLRA